MMDSTPEPLTVRIPEACRMTGIGRSKLYELIKAGEIGIIKVGTITLVPLDGLKRYLGIRSDDLTPSEQGSSIS